MRTQPTVNNAWLADRDDEWSSALTQAAGAGEVDAHGGLLTLTASGAEVFA